MGRSSSTLKTPWRNDSSEFTLKTSSLFGSKGTSFFRSLVTPFLFFSECKGKGGYSSIGFVETVWLAGALVRHTHVCGLGEQIIRDISWGPPAWDGLCGST